MKKSKNNGTRDGLIIIIAIIILIGIGLVCLSKDNKIGAKYSVDNDSEVGYSVIYTALKELGLKVSVDYVPVEEMSPKDCYVIVGTDWVDIEALRDWTKKGGTLVYIGTYPEYGEDIKIDHLGEGEFICFSDVDALSNKWLVDDKSTAYEFYSILSEELSNKKIVFNEYYMYYAELASRDGQGQISTGNLWTAMPLWLRVIVLQGVLCVILYFIYAGRRFGKAQRLVSEVERAENEYIYSVAEIYKQAGAWDLALSSYYQALENKLKQLTRKDGDFLTIWKEESMPELEIATQVSALVKNKNQKIQKGKLKKKEIIPILEQIAYLMKIIDKRREQYWKL